MKIGTGGKCVHHRNRLFGGKLRRTLSPSPHLATLPKFAKSSISPSFTSTESLTQSRFRKICGFPRDVGTEHDPLPRRKLLPIVLMLQYSSQSSLSLRFCHSTCEILEILTNNPSWCGHHMRDGIFRRSFSLSLSLFETQILKVQYKRQTEPTIIADNFGDISILKSSF